MGKNIKNMIMIGIGLFFLGLGAIGVVVPVLPTTPFLLLASYFFARGSKRFHTWFTQTRLYKKYLESYVETRGMTKKVKKHILLTSSSMLLIAFLLVPNIHAKIFIVIVIVFKYYYFFFQIKTIPNEGEQ